MKLQVPNSSQHGWTNEQWKLTLTGFAYHNNEELPHGMLLCTRACTEWVWKPQVGTPNSKHGASNQLWFWSFPITIFVVFLFQLLHLELLLVFAIWHFNSLKTRKTTPLNNQNVWSDPLYKWNASVCQASELGKNKWVLQTHYCSQGPWPSKHHSILFVNNTDTTEHVNTTSSFGNSIYP